MEKLVEIVLQHIEESVDLHKFEDLYPKKPVDREKEYPIGIIQDPFTRKLYIFRKLFRIVQDDAYATVREQLKKALDEKNGADIFSARGQLMRVNELTPIFELLLARLMCHYLKVELEVDNLNIHVREGWIAVISDDPPCQIEEVLAVCAEKL